jgi:hypothetical protein
MFRNESSLETYTVNKKQVKKASFMRKLWDGYPTSTYYVEIRDSRGCLKFITTTKNIYDEIKINDIIKVNTYSDNIVEIAGSLEDLTTDNDRNI